MPGPSMRGSGTSNPSNIERAPSTISRQRARDMATLMNSYRATLEREERLRRAPPSFRTRLTSTTSFSLPW